MHIVHARSKTKTNEIIERLSAMRVDPQSVSQIEWAAIDREVKLVLKASPEEGYMLQGIVASLKKASSSEIIGLFEKALRLSSSSSAIHSNFSLALKDLRKYELSLYHAEQACKFAHAEEHSLMYKDYMDAKLFAFQFDISDGSEEFEYLASFMKANNITNADLFPYFQIVQGINAENMEFNFYAPIPLLYKDDLEYISIQLPVRADYQEVSRLRMELIDRLVDDENIVPNNLISVNYICA